MKGLYSSEELDASFIKASKENKILFLNKLIIAVGKAKGKFKFKLKSIKKSFKMKALLLATVCRLKQVKLLLELKPKKRTSCFKILPKL